MKNNNEIGKLLVTSGMLDTIFDLNDCMGNNVCSIKIAHKNRDIRELCEEVIKVIFVCAKNNGVERVELVIKGDGPARPLIPRYLLHVAEKY